jgi:hypothetical protein
MTKNVKTLLQTKFLDWLIENSDSPTPVSLRERANFWVTPLAEADPDYQSIIKHLIKEYSDASTIAKK